MTVPPSCGQCHRASLRSELSYVSLGSMSGRTPIKCFEVCLRRSPKGCRCSRSLGSYLTSSLWDSLAVHHRSAAKPATDSADRGLSFSTCNYTIKKPDCGSIEKMRFGQCLCGSDACQAVSNAAILQYRNEPTMLLPPWIRGVFPDSLCRKNLGNRETLPDDRFPSGNNPVFSYI